VKTPSEILSRMASVGVGAIPLLRIFRCIMFRC
jgi:hypothetical protein